MQNPNGDLEDATRAGASTACGRLSVVAAEGSGGCCREVDGDAADRSYILTYRRLTKQ